MEGTQLARRLLVREGSFVIVEPHTEMHSTVLPDLDRKGRISYVESIPCTHRSGTPHYSTS